MEEEPVALSTLLPALFSPGAAAVILLVVLLTSVFPSPSFLPSLLLPSFLPSYVISFAVLPQKDSAHFCTCLPHPHCRGHMHRYDTTLLPYFLACLPLPSPLLLDFGFVFCVSPISSQTLLGLSHCCPAPLIVLKRTTYKQLPVVPGARCPLALLPLHPGNSSPLLSCCFLNRRPPPFLDLLPYFCGSLPLVAC